MSTPAKDISTPAQLPDWLLEEACYTPPKDRDSFILKSSASVAGVLAHFRLDDGQEADLAPSAPAKLIFGFCCILMTSLSTNFFFTLVMLGLVLVRLCLLPAAALKRAVSVALVAGVMSFCIMLPAVLLGQSHSAVLIATKVVVSVGICMTVALSTPFSKITAALRVFHVPDLVILTIDLALKNIVGLGTVALEVLGSLRLRSVGRNNHKTTSMGGVSGVVFMKAGRSAQDTFDAMRCRGFEGEYRTTRSNPFRLRDLALLAVGLVLFGLFIYLQGAM